MTPFETYKEYLFIKNHFTIKKYDYFRMKSNPPKFNEDKFNARKDVKFFLKLSKHPDLTNFLVSNFYLNPKLWIGNLVYSETAEKNYKDWIKKQQSLTYSLKEELSELDENFNNNFIVPKNEHPILLKKFLSKKISLETLFFILELSDAVKYWDLRMKEDIIWNEVKSKINKYIPFIEYEKDKIKQIILDFYSK